MLYIAYFIIVSGHNINFLGKFSIFDLQRVENCLFVHKPAIEF